MLMVSLFCSLCTVQSILTLQWYVKSQNWSFASYTSSDIKWKQFINTSFYALCVPARHTFVPDGEDLVEISTFRRERAGRRERERTSLLLFLQQAPLLAFHPATWAPLLWPGSYFSSGNHLLKTDFRKPCCPATAFPINQAAEMPPPTPSIRYPPDCRQTSTHSICSGNTRTQTLILAFPLTFHHISFVVAVIVAVRGPVVDVEALDGSVVVTRGTILHGGELEKKITFRLQQSPRQLLHKREEIFQQLMAGLVISRCTRLEARRRLRCPSWSSGNNESDWG